jgi:hypothetical protein
MKLKKLLPAAVIALFAFASCKKNSIVKPAVSPAAVVDIVYTAGYTADAQNVRRATIWKNGAMTILDSTSSFSFVQSIKLVGADVYAVGIVYDSHGVGHQTYWKNGIKNTIGTLSAENGPMFDVTVLDGLDLYTAGSVPVVKPNSVEAISNATYWKNGIATTLDTNYSQAFSITIAGSDVYTAGITVPILNGAIATYWKNGIKTILNSTMSYANVIAVNGSDIYVAGVIENELDDIRFALWKNGVLAENPDNLLSLGSTYALKTILINGTDVYVGGFASDNNTNNVMLWKNGVPTTLDIGGTAYGNVSAIALNGSDVYAGGQTVTGAAAYWKNGVPVQLNPMGGVNGLFLATH